jgi:hypothetical protein
MIPEAEEDKAGKLDKEEKASVHWAGVKAQGQGGPI